MLHHFKTITTQPLRTKLSKKRHSQLSTESGAKRGGRIKFERIKHEPEQKKKNWQSKSHLKSFINFVYSFFCQYICLTALSALFQRTTMCAHHTLAWICHHKLMCMCIQNIIRFYRHFFFSLSLSPPFARCIITFAHFSTNSSICPIFVGSLYLSLSSIEQKKERNVRHHICMSLFFAHFLLFNQI